MGDSYYKVRSDALDLRWYDKLTSPNYDPKPSDKRSITLKFHDGAMAGSKFVLDKKDKYTLGTS